jgi:hypothetical protein
MMRFQASSRRCPVVLASVALITASARAQTGQESENVQLRAENAAIREQLRKLEEQQKALFNLVDELRQRLDGQTAVNARGSPPPTSVPVPPAQATLQSPQSAATIIGQNGPLYNDAIQLEKSTAPDDARNVSTAGKPIVLSTTTDASSSKADTALNDPAVTDSASTTPPPASVTTPQTDDDRYRDGMVIWQTQEDAKVPFLLKFNVNTQIRYLNTLDSLTSFTDHLGNVYPVHLRNDITVNRFMFILGGYIFDRRLVYSGTVWTAAGAASIVVAGNIGWVFNKALTITAGYTGVPGSRSLVSTFPFFTASDRSMADNFFRPGFTQGVWASGEPVKGLNYLMMLANGLNTLNISAAKIDTNLAFSGSLWWEPLGPYVGTAGQMVSGSGVVEAPGVTGNLRNMYDDYFASKKVRIRIGTAFTQSRENRFANLDQTTPDNTSLYNSDGVLTFSTGAFAPGVTLNYATYKMWATDWGIKWNGLAVNGQYFTRWLGNFDASGPLPLKSTFDHGGEFSASYFVKPKTWMPYIRGSWVIGQFGNSYEYGGGVKWFYLPTGRTWLQAELFRVNKSPYSGTFTPYTAGLTGWVPMLQWYLAF